MKKFVNLFSGPKQAELYNVEYQFYGDISEDIDLKCEDTISVLDTNDQRLRVLVKRRIEFNPQNLFSVSASYFVDHFLEKNLVGKIKWDDYDIPKELNENLDFFAAREVNRLSLIISQITGSFGNSPLITPPIFETDSDDTG